jgi:hypothetical protein
MSKTKELKVKRTITEILNFAGMNEDQVASLLSENTIGKQKVLSWSRPLTKALNDLSKREESYKRRAVKINLDEIELRVGAKRLQAEEIDLDKKLYTKEQMEKGEALKVIEFLEVEIAPKDVNTGNEQLITTYLKMEFAKVKVTMGLVTPEPPKKIETVKEVN